MVPEKRPRQQEHLLYSGMGKKVTLVAADTYRAAAVEQLKIWSKRVGCKLICNEKTI